MRLMEIVEAHPLVLVLIPLLLCGLFGLAVLGLLLAPERSRRAVDQLSNGAVRNLVLGLLPLLAGSGLLVTLFATGIPWGRNLLAVFLTVGVGLGLGVCARRLGERALPEAGFVRQTMLGLLALLLPLLLPPCWPLLVIASGLGLGAWLRAHQR